MTKNNQALLDRKKLNFALVAIILALVMGAFAATYAFGESTDARLAVVKDADGNEYVLSLSEDAQKTVTTSAGTNVVVVENGTVRVTDADCPNHDCVEQGAISKAGQQIVCLPHKLTIDISDENAEAEYDVVGS